MPNIKSAKKRVLISEARNARNRAERSALRTAVKKFEAAVEANDKENVNALYNNAVKKLDQSVKQGILHKNNAARKKSQLALKLAKMA